MLDIALLRSKPDWVKEQIRKLNDESVLPRIDLILTLDGQRREMRTASEQLQSLRNDLNRAMGHLRGDKKLDDTTRAARAAAAASAINESALEDAAAYMQGRTEVPATTLSVEAAFEVLTAALGELGAAIDINFREIKRIEDTLQEQMMWLPNLPHESVPVGLSEDENRPWPPEGEMPEFDFEPRAHWDLGPELGVIDFERGVKLSGTRFYVLQGWGARLQRALISFFLDMAREKGYTELYLPYLVREEMMFGASQFPKFRDVVYYDQEAELYLLPTAEVAITNLHRDEILDEQQLPLYYVAHTPCFRSEKASAGKDTRGIKRVHQFEKVETYKFTTPETSYAELETMAEGAADICRRLELPFRRLEIVTGDLGFSASKKYDIEVWSAGCQEWLEVSSCSNTEEFQARRAGIRYRPADNPKQKRFVHTLNGSALALPRIIIAILENYQQADGSVLIPQALRPYLGGAERITKA